MLSEWRPVVGYEGLYEVSNQGAVRSVERVTTRTNGTTQSVHARELKATLAGSDKRKFVNLSRDGHGKTRPVHRLVAEAFVAGQFDGAEVRHFDGDRLNNAAMNLRWGTPSENRMDSVRHGTHHEARKTHCIRGHEYTPENTGIQAAGRYCRTCNRTKRERK